MIKFFYRLIPIYIIVLITHLFQPIFASESPLLDKKKLLIIHSYHQGFEWTDDVHNGITDQLDDSQWVIYTEYIDSYRKSNNGANYVSNKILSSYSSMDLSAIVVSDNTAFEFINTIKGIYFPDVPLLFVGINSEDYLDPPPNATGIYETLDHTNWFEWLNKELSDITNIIVVGEDTTTANQLFSSLNNTNTDLGFSYKLIPLFSDNLENQIEQLKTYPQESTVIYVAGAFNELDHGEYASLLEEELNLYTFTSVKIGIEGNVMGGNVIDSYEHGQAISTMLTLLSTGKSIDEIDPITKPMQHFIFNYNALQHYKLNDEILPSNSTLINAPDSSITINKTTLYILYGIIVIFIISLIFISYIFYITNRSKRAITRAKIELQEVNMDLEAHTEELIASQEELDHQFHQLKKSEKKLAYLANYDQLTSYMNQRQLLKTIDTFIDSNIEFSVICVIFSHFDSIAYNLGYEAHDKALRHTTQIVKDELGETHYKYGIIRGDILSIICDNPKNIIADISALHKRLKARMLVDNYYITLDPKFGVANSKDGLNNSEELLSKSTLAGMSIYNNSNEFISIFDPVTRYKYTENRQLQNEIDNAIKDNQFILYLQPKYSLDGKTILGYEALIRWKLPNGTIRYPDEFIDLAEKTGQIIDIDYYMINEACRLISKYDLYQKHIHIAINLSSKHFDNDNIIMKLNQTLETYNLPKDALELEITETSLMTNIDNTISLLQRLKDLGYIISIDDLGTGYSSLSYLRDFPVNKVKIDKSFVQLMPNIKNQIIVEILIDLCKRLGYLIVIEGVETREQWDILTELEPNELQGYFFSKPLYAEDILKLNQHS